MKKLKFLFTATVISLILPVFWSCKSVPEAEVYVNPLDLIDNKSSFYFRVPTLVDPDFVQRMIQSNVEGLSESDAEKIVKRIDTMYLGVTKRRKSTDFQISADCNFPQIAVKKAFSKKNGWNSDLYTYNTSLNLPMEYSVYQRSGMYAAFPAQKIACLGRNVTDMVKTYHSLAWTEEKETENAIPEEIRNWLSYDDEDSRYQIRFYAANPQSFLTVMMGVSLNYQLSFVKGKLISDPKDSDQFFMDIEFEFRENRFLLPAKAVISLAFGLTDSDIKTTSDSTIIVSHIKYYTL